MARTDYDPLRAAHQAALDAANSPTQPVQDSSESEPTRPEGHYGQKSSSWTSAGGMEQQQASAAQWAKVSNERLEAERAGNLADQPANEKAQGAHDTLEQHVDGGKSAAPAATGAESASWQRDLGEGIAAREVTGPAPQEVESESLSM